jgi:TRAP-type C4-dicarboxylate transport system permease small subunit
MTKKISYIPEWEQPTSTFNYYIIRFGEYWAWLAFLSVLVSTYEVIVRYVFNSPTSWGHELTTFINAIFIAYGCIYTEARSRHVKVNWIYENAGKKLKQGLDLLRSIILMIFATGTGYGFYIFSKKAIIDTDGNFYLETSGTSWNPPFPAFGKTFFLIVMILLFCQGIITIYQVVKAICAKDTKGETS